MGEMTDDELIGYCDIYCETPRALFSSEQVNRMIKLAGSPPNYPLKVEGGLWWSAHEAMKELVEAARRRRRFKVIQGGKKDVPAASAK